MKTLLLLLPLLTSVAGAMRLRHGELHGHDNSLFRRQDMCPIGYKPCPDGDCCEIGETCTQSRGVKLCAGYACDAGVQTCTASGVTACCQRVGERCHPTNPGICTMPIGGGGDDDDGDLSFTIFPVPDPTTTSSDKPEYTLKPQPDRTSSEEDDNVPTSTDVFTETTVQTSASSASETRDSSVEPGITTAPSESETSERETASDITTTADQDDGARLVRVSLHAVVGACAGLGVGLWFL